MVRLLCYDTETTGTDPAEAAIVEIGAAVLELRGRGWYVVDKRRQRINPGPGRSIPAEASAVHGITDAHVRAKPTLASVAYSFADFVRGYAPFTPLGYNAVEYDYPLLRAELGRAGAAEPLEAVELLGRSIDPLPWIRWHHRDWSRRTLGEACRVYGVELRDAHSALADALAAGYLWLAMQRKGLVPLDPLAALEEQDVLRARLRREQERFGWWLYEDRRSGALRMGCGKDRQQRPLCGRALREVDPGYLRWVLREVQDLPAEAREVFSSLVERRAA